VLVFILTQFFEILSFESDDNYQKYLNLLIFMVFLTTVIAILVNVFAIKKTYYTIGNKGDVGIRGEQGKKGSKGHCDTRCGQKICYLNVVDYANEIFKKEVKKLMEPDADGGTVNVNAEITGINLDEKAKITNRDFLKKLQKICVSDEYYDILTKKHDKKPSEFKLIEYIKEIIKEWIILIIGNSDDNNTQRNFNKRGYIFLTTPALEMDNLDSIELDIKIDGKTVNSTVLKEMKKYDLFRWGESAITKKKKIYLKSDSLSHPKPNESRLYSIKSNNYEPIYNARAKQDIWDTENCPYNQMGTNMDNPNNLDKCIYIEPNGYTKAYHKTWKNTEFFKPQELSLYNTQMYETENNQKFYPLGTVWRGKNSYEKPEGTVNLPSSNTKCGDGHGEGKSLQHSNKGPEKETILVSGDVVDPVSYEKIWDSKQKCPECQINHTQVFRPKAPEGYTCIGDVAIPWTENEDLQQEVLEKLNIKCLPNDCLEEMNIGPKVWNNKDFRYNKYNSYRNYASKAPYKTNKQLGTSFWDAGNSNSREEIINNYGIQLEENGGYNLFRASKDYKLKPKMKSYKIKQQCLLPGQGKSPKKINFNLDKIKEKLNPSREQRYNTDEYFGEKPDMAILTNKDDLESYAFDNEEVKSFKNIKNEVKKLYLLDDGHKRGTWQNGKKQEKPSEVSNIPDTYIIKTFNEEKNDFSNTLYYKEIDEDTLEVYLKPSYKMSSKYNKWVVNYNDEPDSVGTSAASGATNNMANVSIHPEDKPNFYLRCYFNEMGQNKFVLQKINDDETNNFNWIYETPVAMELPQKKNP
tara:strand:- start:1428 stop:3842 length:2415 start_codon:yes stop_codon:yes gene_type:complete